MSIATTNRDYKSKNFYIQAKSIDKGLREVTIIDHRTYELKKIVYKPVINKDNFVTQGFLPLQPHNKEESDTIALLEEAIAHDDSTTGMKRQLELLRDQIKTSAKQGLIHSTWT